MAKGPDISTFQGTPNFDELSKHADFVMIRSSYGNGFKAPFGANQYRDVQFDRNRDEARRVGIAHGFYHYCYPQYNNPEEEADYFRWILGDLQPGEVLALDFEEPYGGDKDDWCVRFLNRMKDHYGFRPLLYINLSTANSIAWSRVRAGDYGLWVAVWNNNHEFPKTPWNIVAMKQFTDSATIPGIAGKVDMNVFNGDTATFRRYGKQSPAPIPVPEPIPQPEPEPIPEPTPEPEPIPEPIPEPQPPVSIFEVSVQGLGAYTSETFPTEAEAKVRYEEEKLKLQEGQTVLLNIINLTKGITLNIIFYVKPTMSDPVVNPPAPIESIKYFFADIIARLFSRKFLLVVGSIITVWNVPQVDQRIAILTSVGLVIAYLAAEGSVDAARELAKRPVIQTEDKTTVNQNN